VLGLLRWGQTPFCPVRALDEEEHVPVAWHGQIVQLADGNVHKPAQALLIAGVLEKKLIRLLLFCKCYGARKPAYTTGSTDMSEHNLYAHLVCSPLLEHQTIGSLLMLSSCNNSV